MDNRVFRPFDAPERTGLSWEERWRGPDHGLIACWEAGRKIGKRDHELSNRAQNGELPILVWKGGVEKKTKQKVRHGTLKYLAQWQGLRGDDLDIDLGTETELVCSRTEMRVVFTSDVSKYAEP